jgi:hypothetical protein
MQLNFRLKLWEPTQGSAFPSFEIFALRGLILAFVPKITLL